MVPRLLSAKDNKDNNDKKDNKDKKNDKDKRALNKNMQETLQETTCVRCGADEPARGVLMPNAMRSQCGSAVCSQPRTTTSAISGRTGRET